MAIETPRILSEKSSFCRCPIHIPVVAFSGAGRSMMASSLSGLRMQEGENTRGFKNFFFSTLLNRVKLDRKKVLMESMDPVKGIISNSFIWMRKISAEVDSFIRET